MKKISIINLGVGNLLSVSRAIEYNHYNPIITSKIEDLRDSSHLILPGVGGFADAYKKLCKYKLDLPIKEHAEKGKPILGICLGMQLLGDTSEEGGFSEGLGLIQGDTKLLPQKDRFSGENLKIPHIGWNTVFSDEEKYSENLLFSKKSLKNDFYHLHSYQFIENNPKNRIGHTLFGNHKITVAIRDGNIFGTQFHPEKSGVNGLKLIRNFLDID